MEMNGNKYNLYQIYIQLPRFLFLISTSSTQFPLMHIYNYIYYLIIFESQRHHRLLTIHIVSLFIIDQQQSYQNFIQFIFVK